PLAREKTILYVQKLPFLELLASFDNARDALVFLKTRKVDLIFLDINLGELSGIQLLETSKINSEVIIATAYPDFALKGYELDVTDYLLKPYTFERLVQAVEKVQQKLLKRDAGDKKFIFVKTENRLEKILFDDVLYIEGMRDYRSIFTKGKRIMTLQTFKWLEEEVPSNILCRVHKSFMVSLAKIESVERDRIRIGEKFIPISETYKQSFLQLIDRAG
ncbi:MAG: response regulator transcription factor, partial [Bacteroidia bacterium]|nr:response regulator transcription factor [Bacteroidia bacterium]